MSFLLGLASMVALQERPVVEVPARPDADAEACAMMRYVVERAQPDLPMMVDAVTRTDGFSVMCGLRNVAWNKTILMQVSAMRDGWQARKQSQFNAIVCDNDAFGPMQRRGWRFVTNITFLSGERVILEAVCPPKAG